MQSPRRAAMCAALLSVSGTVLLSACAAPNDREMIGRIDDGVRLSLLSPSDDRPETNLKPDEPSMSGLDRSHWDEVVIEEPVDGVYAWHRYARVYHFTDKTTRQRGGPVTALSALERSGPTQTKLVLETATSAPLALVDLALMPFKFFTAPPWEEVRSLPEPYWRTSAEVPVTGQTAPKSDAAAPAGVSP
jgi:hypothetical protein